MPNIKLKSYLEVLDHASRLCESTL